ncbi:MAG: protein-disulfide reductase DsbD N-terminal domain-containing protein [Vicinamibacterales bacterium]
MSPLFVSALSLWLVLAPQRPADVVKWSATGPEKPVVAGSEAKIVLNARIESGWKLYALTQPEGGPLKLAIATPKGTPFAVAAKRIVAPLPKIHTDENFKLDTQYYETEAVFTVPVTVPKTMAAGPQQVPIDVTFQACGESICLRPFTERVTVNITVVK